jgi:P27 family predicted phage terminase small subunit
MAMGKRGPAPAPTSLKLLRGERNQDRINRNEPKPRPTDPTLPDDVSDEVRAVFDETVVELARMGLAFGSDSHALHCYAEAVVAHRHACAVLAKSPVLVKGLHGNLVRNPALQIQRDTAATVRAFAQEFGLTPSARSSISAKDNEDDRADNPFSGTG